MKHKNQRKYGVLILFLVTILTTTITFAAEQSLQLIDVSTGDTQEDSACIFKINGKTVVVDRREKVTVDGIMIYVLEVYPVNTESKQGDRCEFIYSGMEEEKETKIEQEIIGEKVVQFYFGTPEEQTESTEEVEEQEDTEKTIGDNTVVRISGYDVTGLSISAKDDKKTVTISREEDAKSKQESKGIFSKILSWIFG